MPRSRPPKSLLLAYVFWLFFGVFGGHRFYLGKWFTGILYLLSFGFYVIGWGLDAFLLPFMVRRVNQQLAEEEAAEQWEEAEEYHVPRKRRHEEAEGEAVYDEAVEELAPRRKAAPLAGPPDWALQRSGLRPVEFLLRLGFFLFTPCFFTVLAFMLEQWELLVIMMVTMVVGGLLGNAENLMRRYPTLAKIPMFGHALTYINGLTDFYRKQAPFHFAYYLFYPVTCLAGVLASAQARSEFKVFFQLIGALMLVILARVGLTYFEVFPPHLGPADAIFVIVFDGFMVLMWIVMFLVPTATTALTLNVMGRTGQLRTLMVLGLISGLPFGFIYLFTQRAPVPFVAYQLLEERLATDSFRKELDASAEMYLGYWTAHAGDVAETPPQQPALSAEMTGKLQRHLGGIVVGREVQAFRALRWQQGDQGTWLAIGVVDYMDLTPQLLYVAGPDGRIYRNWTDLPAAVRAQFETLPGTKFLVKGESLIGEKRWKRSMGS